MRKIIIMLMCMVSVTSCSKKIDVPNGIWRSENPEIVLYLKPGYQFKPSSVYAGMYYRNGEAIKICALFESKGPSIYIYDMEGLDTGLNRTNRLFGGTPELKGDTLYYEYSTSIPREMMITEFHRTDNYEPIITSDWFPLPKYVPSE